MTNLTLLNLENYLEENNGRIIFSAKDLCDSFFIAQFKTEVDVTYVSYMFTDVDLHDEQTHSTSPRAMLRIAQLFIIDHDESDASDQTLNRFDDFCDSLD
jgi:hypothetical protein